MFQKIVASAFYDVVCSPEIARVPWIWNVFGLSGKRAEKMDLVVGIFAYERFGKVNVASVHCHDKIETAVVVGTHSSCGTVFACNPVAQQFVPCRGINVMADFFG